MHTSANVRLIAIISIVGSIVGLLSMAIFLSPAASRLVLRMVHAPLPVFITQTFISQVVTLVIGIGLLHRQSWARLWLIFVFPATLVTFFVLVSWTLVVVACGVYGVYLIIASRPRVRAYFESKLPLEVVAATATQPVEKPRAKISVARKILSVTALTIGGLFLMLADMIIAVHLADLSVKMIIIGMFGFVSLAFVVIGILLWGKQRWRICSGAVLAIIGGLTLVYGMAMIFMLNSSYVDLIAEADRSVLEMTDMVSSALTGFVSLAMGVLLILLQRKVDH